MESIKMLDLHGEYLHVKNEIDSAIQQVISRADFIQGTAVRQFEEALAKEMNVAHVISCGNGTDALQIALMSLDLKTGDEIILPANSYVAPAEVVVLLGLVPVFADVNPGTFNIDPQKILSLITPKTRAILPVHLFGQCAEMELILEVARKNNLYVIEDAAQSIGASYTFKNGQSKKAGTMGTIGCTSFFPTKNLGCFGDGGALMTDDDTLAKKIRMIANHGQQKKYVHDLPGINSRLDTLQAAILLVKLSQLETQTKRRISVAEQYLQTLETFKEIELPSKDDQSTHVYNQFTIKVSEGRRDDLRKHLELRGIPTMVYYPMPLPKQKAFSDTPGHLVSFPVTENLSKTVISLPVHPQLSEEQVSYICNAIREFGK